MDDVTSNPKLEYWVNTINIHAPNSPILLVATHLDKKKAKAEVQEYLDGILKPLKKKFKQVKEVFAVSTLQVRGIEELKECIAELASKDPCMQTEIPTKLIVFEQLILTVVREQYQANNKVPVISWKEFVEKASSVNIGKTGSEEDRSAEIEKAAELLHMLGTILYFHNGEQELVIIDPEWIIQLFKTLFTTKHAFVKDGIISFKSICDHIWKEPDFPGEFHSTLLDIFEAFEVLFRITKDNDLVLVAYNEQMILIPSLLPTAKPTDLVTYWQGLGDLLYARHYEFQLIPHGLFNRVIFRLMKLPPALRYWRFGVLIKSKKDNTHALVELKSDYVSKIPLTS